MNALQLLRSMHADTRLRFKVMLATEDPADAQRQWQALKPLLDVHERLEDEFVYEPLAEEMGPGTPLGDWAQRHERDVTIVKGLIGDVDSLEPGAPAWREAAGRVLDVLTRHVTDEEGQVFGRIEQAWGAQRLETAGAAIQREKDGIASAKQPTRPRGKAVAGGRRQR